MKLKTYGKFFFPLLIVVVLYLSLNANEQSSVTFSDDPNRTVVLKIFTEGDAIKKLSQAGVAIDHAEPDKEGSCVIAYLFGSELDIIKKLGIRYEIIYNDWYNQVYLKYPELDNQEYQHQLDMIREVDNVSNFPLGAMGGYYTFEQTLGMLDSLRTLYPQLMSSKFQIGTAYNGTPIWAYRLTKDPDQTNNRPQVLYTALIHSREAITVMLMMYYTIYLLENYPTNETVKFLLENRDMYFIPFVNPEGYKYNRKHRPNGGGMRRKNLRNVDTNVYQPATNGIDLNRNFGLYQFWNSPNGGSSTSPSSDTYRGTAPFSEPETQTIQNFVNSKNFQNALFYHSYSNLYIYPWAWIDPVQTPDSLIFKAFTQEMSSYNGYLPGTASQTVGYEVRGSSDDWMYNDSGHEHCISITPEVGTSSDGFWPQQSRIIPLVMQNLQPNIFFAGVAGEYVQYKSFDLAEGSGLDAGDTSRLYISLKSVGKQNASNVSAELIPLDSGVAGLSMNKNFGDFGFLQTKNNSADPFVFIVNENILNGQETNLLVKVKIDNATVSQDTLTLMLGTSTVLLFDKANSKSPNWTATGSGSNVWDTTSSSFYSPPTSFTDSRSGNYGNNVTNILTMVNTIPLGTFNSVKLSFRTKFSMEPGYDYGQVQVSTNNGSTWIALAGKKTRPGSGSFQPNGQPLFNGTQSEWIEESMDLTPYIGHSVKFRFMFKSDIAVTYDGWYIDDIKIWGYENTSAVTGNGEIPLKYSLSQNFPNPFNPITNFSFSLTDEGNAQIEVFDLLGRKITTLVNSQLQAGNYQVSFDGSNLASGIYIYRLTVKNSLSDSPVFIDSKRMLLIK